MRGAGAIVILAVAAVAASGCGGDARGTGAATDGSPTAVEPNATVTRIVDGDTIDVDVDGRTERIRLIGIDTPEIAHPPAGGRPGNDAECFGDEASAFTASLLPVGTAVRLERDVVGRDDYGRLLAYVLRANDGLFVNHELARRGYARPLTIAPNVTHRDLIVDAARHAERDDVGLWSGCR